MTFLGHLKLLWGGRPFPWAVELGWSLWIKFYAWLCSQILWGTSCLVSEQTVSSNFCLVERSSPLALPWANDVDIPTITRGGLWHKQGSQVYFKEGVPSWQFMAQSVLLLALSFGFILSMCKNLPIKALRQRQLQLLENRCWNYQSPSLCSVSGAKDKNSDQPFGYGAGGDNHLPCNQGPSFFVSSVPGCSHPLTWGYGLGL